MPVLPSRLSLIAALLLAQQVAAREDTIPTLGKVSVSAREEASLNLREVSTSASRLGLTALQTPASVDIISAEQLRAFGLDTVTQALSQSATGITTISAPIYGSAYSARGFTGNNSVMQLYDGTRLYIGIGNITFPFDTWTAERIEVLRGPASVLYGEGAIGGVINVVPKQAVGGAIRNTVRLSAGTDDAYGLAVDSGGSLTDDLAYRISASARDAAGWVDRGDNSSRALSGALRWQVAPELALTLTGDYGRQKPMPYFGTPLIDGHLQESLRDKNYNIKNNRILFEDSWTQFKAEWTPTDAITVRNTVYLLDSRREWRNLEAYTWNDANGVIDRGDYLHIIQDQNQLGDRADVVVKSQLFGFDNELVVGFDINDADFSYANNFYPGSGSWGGDSVDSRVFAPGYFSAMSARPQYSSTVKQRAFFAEEHLQLSEQWALVGGIRRDRIEVRRNDRRTPADTFEKTFQTTSWRAGVVYNPLPLLAIYAQYATATDPVAPLLTLPAGQKQFDLTTGKQWELGIKQSLANGRGEWTLAAYEVVKRDLLVRNPTNIMVTDQIGRQSSKGVELTLAFELGAGVRLDANTAWLKAEYEKFDQIDFNTFQVVSYAGQVPVNVPERNANLRLSWNIAQEWMVYLAGQYVGRAYGDYDNLMQRDAYTLAHAGVRWQSPRGTTLALHVRNLADKTYAETLFYSGQQWFLGEPRTAELSAQFSF